MQILLENGRYATLRDPVSCSQCLKRCAPSGEPEGQVGSNNGEMGLFNEICVSTGCCGDVRMGTKPTTGHSVEGLARMTAVGLGLPQETFTDAGRYGYGYSL